MNSAVFFSASISPNNAFQWYWELGQLNDSAYCRGKCLSGTIVSCSGLALATEICMSPNNLTFILEILRDVAFFNPFFLNRNFIVLLQCWDVTKDTSNWEELWPVISLIVGSFWKYLGDTSILLYSSALATESEL